MVITYRIPTPDDMKNVSEQIKRNYVAAYERLMDHDYLSSLKADHWEPILQESIQNGDPCLIAECDGNIIGSTVFGTVPVGDIVREQGIPDTYITLGLFAAVGKEGFYQKQGFHIRPNDNRGAGMEIILSVHQDTGA